MLVLHFFSQHTDRIFSIFGGHKESGIGAEWGTQGLLSYCNPQVIHFYKSKL